MSDVGASMIEKVMWMIDVGASVSEKAMSDD
jgi:hypothetical protein